MNAHRRYRYQEQCLTQTPHASDPRSRQNQLSPSSHRVVLLFRMPDPYDCRRVCSHSPFDTGQGRWKIFYLQFEVDLKLLNLQCLIVRPNSAGFGWERSRMMLRVWYAFDRL